MFQRGCGRASASTVEVGATCGVVRRNNDRRKRGGRARTQYAKAEPVTAAVASEQTKHTSNGKGAKR